MQPRRLSLATMLAFGVGQAAEGFKNQAFNVFLLFYYQQVVGISGSMAGLALGIALIFDAISDPAAGVISDRFKSRWGRRHPFMFVSAFPLVITFVALFNPPAELGQFANFLWLTVFAVLVRGSLTFYYVPHLALGADMAQDYHQRSTLFALSSVFAITAMALVSFVGYLFFFPTTESYNPGILNAEAYEGFSIAFAAAMFAVIMLCCFGTAREIPYLRENDQVREFTVASVIGDFAAAFNNRSFRIIFFGMLLTIFAIAIEAIFSPFIGIHFWGLPTEKLAYVSLATLIGLWIGLPLTPVITRVLDKKWALVIPALFVIINANVALVLRLLDVDWFPGNESPWIFRIYFCQYLLQGICLPVILATFNSMFADIADEIELETGQRSAGVIYSLRSFANKVVGALGAIIGGIVLDVIEFPSMAITGTVNADTIWWLGVVEGPATSLLSICGILLYLRYRIDHTRHQEIVREIALARAP
jgi:GPH family glycoside/pentoside/hexuronide:cation symporter